MPLPPSATEPRLVTLPLPARVPPLQLLDPEIVSAALAVRVPPCICNPALRAEALVTVSEPPVICNGSAAVMLWTVSVPAEWVTVIPGTLMTTSSFGPGTCPVLQFLAVDQSPLAGLVQVTVEDAVVGAKATPRKAAFVAAVAICVNVPPKGAL